MLKKNWPYLLLFFAASFYIYKKFIFKKETINYKIIELKGGYGYQILENDKLFIEQTTIPGVKGYQVFLKEEEAATIANVVIQKMKAKKGAMPSISLKELDSCKIAYLK